LQQEINKTDKKTTVATTLNLGEGHPINGWKVDGEDLYDTNGIKVVGTRRDWAGEMAMKPANETVPQRVWMDKNDPTRKVSPQNFNNWLDKEGNYLTESAPVEEIVQKGYRYVDDKERDNYRAAKVQLDEIKTQWNNLFGKEGVYTKLKEAGENDFSRLKFGGKTWLASNTNIGSDPISIKIREFNKFADRTLPSFAREVGHTGVLTQLDVDSVRPSIGMITPEYMKGKALPDTEEEMKQGLMKLYKLYKSKGIENRELDAMMQEAAIVTKSGIQLYKR
jgi:hypothetical protein